MDSQSSLKSNRQLLPVANRTSPQLEDALSYLPGKGVVEYRRGQVIYDEQAQPNGLSLIIGGRVKVATRIEGASQTVTGLFFTEQFFGVGALLGEHTTHREEATALEITTLMSWTRTEVEEQIERQPRLGLALIQMLAERCLESEEHLQSMALDKAPKRVALSLLHLADRCGTREPDGAVRIPPLTHLVLSEYVGTSREIVTFHMNQLRRQGFLRYSLKAIQIYPEALTEHLRNQQD